MRKRAEKIVKAHYLNSISEDVSTCRRILIRKIEAELTGAKAEGWNEGCAKANAEGVAAVKAEREKWVAKIKGFADALDDELYTVCGIRKRLAALLTEEK